MPTTLAASLATALPLLLEMITAKAAEGVGWVSCGFDTHYHGVCACRPFNNAETFNRLIRNKIQMIKLRNGNRINPNQARRAEGYKELRTAMQVSFS